MIDNFIADFYSYKAKLVIEIDGSQHETDEGMQKDQIRTEKLEEYGLQVIRIPNRCIDKEFYRVCDYIDQVVKNNIGDT
jgi:very-short-patch-repair endonuclease